MINKIKVGDKFICIKDVKMSGNGAITYFKGVVYISEKEECITNHRKDKNHSWNVSSIDDYFVKIESSSTKSNIYLNKVIYEDIYLVVASCFEELDNFLENCGYAGPRKKENWIIINDLTYYGNTSPKIISRRGLIDEEEEVEDDLKLYTLYNTNQEEPDLIKLKFMNESLRKIVMKDRECFHDNPNMRCDYCQIINYCDKTKKFGR